MRNYSGPAVDQYMQTILEQDLSEEKAANAMTLLTALTTLAPEQFPHESTFVRVNKTRLLFHPEIVRQRGITFFTKKQDGEERSITLQLEDLKNLKVAFAALFKVLGDGYSLDDL